MSHFKKHFILLVSLIFSASGLFSQEDDAENNERFHAIYENTWRALEVDPLLQNGISYTNPYYNAEGHPFLSYEEFETALLVYRDRQYEAVLINYDVFNQQVIYSSNTGEVTRMNVLVNELIGEFNLNGRRFVAINLPETPAPFLELVAEQDDLHIYRHWYKTHREIDNSSGRRIFSFSESKWRNYICLDEKLQRFKNNRTFINAFPEEEKDAVKGYLKEQGIKVEQAGDSEFAALLENYCSQRSAAEKGGEQP